MKQLICALFLLLGIILLCGCGTEGNKYTVNALKIDPASVMATSSQEVKLSCKAAYADGVERDFSPAWSLSSNFLGTISQDGVFRAGANASTIEGQAIATYGALKATAEVKVTPSSAVMGASLPIIPQGITVINVTPYSATVIWSGSADGYIVSGGLDSSANSGTTEAITPKIDLTFPVAGISLYVKIKSYKNTFAGRVYSDYSLPVLIKLSDYPAKYFVQDNKIVDDQGKEVVFRGVNILDPAWMDTIYHNLDDAYFAQLEAWKVKIIRIPVHPAAYKYYGPANYLNLLDKTLVLAANHKIYAIIDYHSIGFPPNGTYNELLGTDVPWTGSIYAYTESEMKDFWSAIANRYKDDNRVVFYELFNEPTAGVGGDAASWLQWKTKAEELIDHIRVYDPDAKVIVGGLNYSYDVSFAADNPVNRPNVVYGTHPYPNLAESERAFGSLKDKYPVFATEFGFDPAATGKHYQADTQYGNGMIIYLESKKISWTVWNFSPDWLPALLTDWNYNTTTSGSLYKTLLQNLN